MSADPDFARLRQLPKHWALIALGANLGLQRQTFEAALQTLDKQDTCRVALRSSWHVTAPAGGPSGQPDFLNGAALLETTLSPERLLDLLHVVEAQHGRKRGLPDEVPNGPRTLDLDLLMQASETRQGSGLILPHPRMHERVFVLAPVAELVPKLELGDQTVAQLLIGLKAAQQS